MNSFNNIEKHSFSKHQSDPVSLEEYILFSDDERAVKQVLFKFRNNLNQPLKDFKCEISEFDKDNNLIEKVVFEHHNFVAIPQEVFAPNGKLNLNYNCKTIDVRLVEATFERCYYENGKFSIIKYSKAEYRNDYGRAPKVLKPEPYKTPRKMINRKRGVKVRNLNRINRPKGPKVFAVIFSIILLGLLTFTAFYSNKKIHKYNYKGVDYVESGDGLIASGVDKLQKVVVIPEVINKKPVVKIDEKAFADAQIEQLGIYAKNVEILKSAFKGCENLNTIYDYNNGIKKIYENAFEGCRSLKKLSFKNLEHVYSNAFKDCVSLEKVDFPKAVIEPEAFVNCPRLVDITIKKTAVSLFYKIFVREALEFLKFEKITLNTDFIGLYYFDHINTYDLVLPKGCQVQYGALKELKISSNFYHYNLYQEFLHGEIVSNADSIETVVVEPDTPFTEFQYVLNNYRNTIKNIYINARYSIDASVLGELPALISFGYTDAVDFASDSFDNIYNNLSLTVDSSCKPISQVFNNVQIIKEVTVKKSYSSYVNLADLPNLTKVKIESDFNSQPGLFKNSNKIESIEMPLPNFTLAELNVPSTISELIFTDSNAYTLKENFVNGYADLKKLVIPNTVTFMEHGIISGCDNLLTVSLPFIGNTFDQSLDYSNINLSFESTINLTITHDSYVQAYQFFGCSRLSNLAYEGKILNDPTELLASVSSLEALTLNGKIGETLGEVFGCANEAVSLKRLTVIGKTELPEKYALHVDGLEITFK